MLRAFPLLIVAVILYNLVAFGAGFAGHHDMGELLAYSTAVTMVSGDAWKITAGDAFLLFSFMLLFVEVVKATRASSREVVNHALSMLTFVGALLEFVLLKGFATSAFFFVTLMTLFDVTAGYTISILAAKRDTDVRHIDEA